MRHWVRRVAAGVVVLGVVCAVGAAYEDLAERRDLAAAPPPGRLIDVGGHRLHVWCEGHGTPAVVFEAAAGGSSLGWYRVQQDVARFTTACTYDRAGMGYSEAGPAPRTSRRIANELAELIHRSGLPLPVVLVGWSYGGFTVRAYATAHETDAAALVLVDASHEDQVAKFAVIGIRPGIPLIAPLLPAAAALGVLRVVPNPFVSHPDSAPEGIRRFVRATMYRPRSFQTNDDEQRHFLESADEIRSSRRTLAVPLVVLTAGQGAPNAMSIWNPLQRDLLQLSHRSCQMIATNADHLIPYEDPEAVVHAVHVAIEAWRTSSSPHCS